MLLELANVPTYIQRFINDALHLFCDNFFPVYLDDILIYGKTLHVYKVHIKIVLIALSKAGLRSSTKY